MAIQSGGSLRIVPSRIIHSHPVSAVVSVVIAGFIAVSMVFAGLGLLIKNQLGVVSRWDIDVIQWLADHRTSGTNEWTRLATGVADTLGILVVLVVAIVVLILMRRRWAALFLGLALALELMSFLTVNNVVDRPRPDVVRLGTLPATSSFPSGHTAAIVALYGGLALIFSDQFRSWAIRIVMWLAVLLATSAIGFGRVYRGMHYPSDAVAGALLGLAVLGVAFVAVRVGQLARAERNGVPSEKPGRSFFLEVVQ